MQEPIGKAYKPWLVASLIVLIGSLLLLCVTMTIAFVNYSGVPTPIWIVAVGAVAISGVALGFAGFLLIMLTAGWHSFREARRVQIIPPPKHP